MSSTVVKKEKNEVTLKIEVDHEQFEKAVQEAYQRTKHKFSISGFRKGKAPRKLIEAYYGEGVFYDEAINQICPVEYEKAIKDQNLEPVDRPTIDIEEIGKGKNFVFTATVTVKPELVLGQYKGIEAEKKEYNVKEEDVENEIEMLRDKNSRMVVVERPVQEGDYVLIDYKGFVGDEQFDGGTAEKQNLLIGSGRFIPGFEEQLVGAKAGDDVTVQVKFPEDYHVEKLAGQDAVFHVKINEVKEKQLPELDDEFAKDVSEHDTLEALKEDIRKKQEEAVKKKAEDEFKNEVLKKVIENAQVDIPEVMVENQIDNMLNDFDFQLRYQGMDLDTYLKFSGSKLEDLRNQMRDDAYDRVKMQLTLEAVAKAENIEASQEDIDAEIEKYAEEFNMELDKLKESLEQNNYEYIQKNIVVQKTVDFLVEHAVAKPAE